MEQDLKISNRLEKGEIELWDCSGDLKYALNNNYLSKNNNMF